MTQIAAPAPWIVNRSYDQFFLWGAWIVPWVLWGIASTGHWGLLAALFLFVLLDNSHQISTLPLTLLDPGTARSSRRFYTEGFLLIGGLALVISFYPESTPARLWTSLMFYWGPFHILRQHYGFLRLYQTRKQPRNRRFFQAEALALYSGVAFSFLFAFTRGYVFHGYGERIYRFPLPLWTPWVAFVVFTVSLLIAFRGAYLEFQSTRKAPGFSLLILFLAVSNFWVAMLWLGRSDVLLLMLFIGSFHDVQYHAIVWHIGRLRFRNEANPSRPSVRQLFQSAAVFLTVVFVVGLIQEAFRGGDALPFLNSALEGFPQIRTSLFFLFGSYTYMHYLFDSKLWKISEDARLRAELGIGSATARPAQG